ncbi:MAG: hypothetical protein IKK73_02495 [Akkermansia sp.]|nr:hypothetical protein [Akkermansia sp.]
MASIHHLLGKVFAELLMGERHELRNRYLRIDEDPAAEQVTEQVTEQVQETLPETVALLVARMGDERYMLSVRGLLLKNSPGLD